MENGHFVGGAALWEPLADGSFSRCAVEIRNHDGNHSVRLKQTSSGRKSKNHNLANGDNSMGAAKIIGLLCIVFGIADVALSRLEIVDLTGVQ